MVGTFYRAPAPDASSYVEVGATVSPGDTLCIIEAMKLFNEIKSDVTGSVRRLVAGDGDLVKAKEGIEVAKALPFWGTIKGFFHLLRVVPWLLTRSRKMPR